MLTLLNFLKSILCAFLIAITYILGKKLGTTTTPEILAMLRFVISTLCFLPFINLKEYKNLNLYNIFLLILASFFGIFLYNDLLFLAVKYTSPINISLVNATIPLLTLALASILNLKIPSRKQGIAFFLSFVGVMLVITKGVFTTDVFKATHGELIMLMGASSWVLYGFIIRLVMRDFSPLFTSFVTGLMGGLMLLVLSFHNQTFTSIYHLQTYQWWYIGYIGSFGTAIVFFLYTQIIKNIGPTLSNLIIFSSAPIFVTLISYFFLGIPLNTWQLIGGSLVLCALALQK